MPDMLDVAVLVDGGFLVKHMKRHLHLTDRRRPTADDFVSFAKACVDEYRERLFRIFFYDSPPFDGEATHPIYKTPTKFRNKYFKYRRDLLKNLAQRDHLAFRSGFLHFVGWKLTRQATNDLIAGKRRDLRPDDIQPDFRQKCVDMKIGLDVAWLSSKRIVDKIILVTNDRDFIPPMKHARKEGVRVAVVEWYGKYKISPELREHADEVRTIMEQDGKFAIHER